MSELLNGSCLCGSITYSCSAEPAMTAVCHCTDCQKQSGSMGSVLVGVPAPAFEVSGDTLSVWETVGEDRGTPARRSFCSTCGCPTMSTLPEMADLVFIKAGTLDDTSWLEPQVEVWGDSAQPWVIAHDQRPRMPRGVGS